MVKRYIKFILLILFVFGETHSLASDYDLGWFNQSVDGVYHLRTKNDFLGLIYKVNVEECNFTGMTVVLDADVDGSDFEPIHSWSGTMLGNGHTISSLTHALVNQLEKDGHIDGVNILSSGSIKSVDGYSGSIANICLGTISNCSNKCRISTSISREYGFAGGICGELNGGTIVGCRNDGDVSLTVIDGGMQYFSRVGGICGRILNGGKVLSCANYGAISSSSDSFSMGGGITGDAQHSIIRGVENKGRIVCTTSLQSSQTLGFTADQCYTGGICGYSQHTTLDRCANSGSVTNYTGYVAGIVGYSDHTNIYNCSNSGDVVSTNHYYYSCAAGIAGCFSGVGVNYDFVNCVNTGHVSANTSVGTATAAGICLGINNGNIANLLSFDNVSAQGETKSKTFTIQGYEYEGGTEYNTPINLDDVNTFIADTPLINDVALLPWETNSKQLPSVNCYAQTTAGSAMIYLYCSEGDNHEYTIHAENFNGETSIIVKNGVFCATDLLPATSYRITVESVDGRICPESFCFVTKFVDFNCRIKEIGFTNCIIEPSIIAKDINILGYGLRYKRADEVEWRELLWDSLKDTSLDNLSLETKYLYQQFILCDFGEVSGEIYSFDTKPVTLAPSLYYTRANSLIFKTNDPEILRNYVSGVAIYSNGAYSMHVPFNYTDDGLAEITGLAPQHSYKVYSYIEKNGVIEYKLIGSFNTLDIDFYGCVNVSPNAVMLHGSYLGTISTSTSGVGTTLRTIYFQLNAINQEKSAFYRPAIITKDSYEIYGTIPLLPNIYMCRSCYMSPVNDAEPQKSSDWQYINTQTITCDVVPPLFRDISMSVGTAGVSLSSVIIDGEESVKSIGIQYKGLEDDYFIDNTIKKSNTPTFTINAPVAGKTYVGRFWARTANAEFYSDSFLFRSDGMFEIVNVDTKYLTSLPNSIYVRPLEMPRGKEIELDVCMQNYVESTSYQFDVVLPEGFHVVNTIDGEVAYSKGDRNADYAFSVVKQPNNVVRVIGYSPYNNSIAGHEGSILSLKVSTDSDMVPGLYSVNVRNAHISDVDGTNIPIPETKMLMKVPEYIIGDVNQDGSVSIGDIASLIAHIQGVTVPSFNFRAADTNKDMKVTSADISNITKLLFTK